MKTEGKPPKKLSTQNFDVTHLTYLRLHDAIVTVFESGAVEARTERVAEVLRDFNSSIEADEVDRVLSVAMNEVLTAGSEVDLDTDPFDWLLSLGGPVVAAERLASILKREGMLPDTVGGPSLAKHLDSWAKDLGMSRTEVLIAGRGSVSGRALPMMLLLRDLLGFENANVEAAVRILIPHRTIVERVPSTTNLDEE